MSKYTRLLRDETKYRFFCRQHASVILYVPIFKFVFFFFFAEERIIDFLKRHQHENIIIKISREKLSALVTYLLGIVALLSKI